MNVSFSGVFFVFNYKIILIKYFKIYKLESVHLIEKYLSEFRKLRRNRANANKKRLPGFPKALISLVGREGFEPTTSCV